MIPIFPQRKEGSKPGVKVIVCSGYFNDPVMAHYGEHGFRGAMPKPYQKADLERVLKKVQGDQSSISGANRPQTLNRKSISIHMGRSIVFVKKFSTWYFTLSIPLDERAGVRCATEVAPTAGHKPAQDIFKNL